MNFRLLRENQILLATVKVRRLEWAGHALRMCDDSNGKKVFLGKPDGRRKTGGPKLRWLDCIENDIISVGVQRRRSKVEDSSVWAIIRVGQWLNYTDYMQLKEEEEAEKEEEK